MAKLLILRAFFETSNGGYYSPLNRECYTLLPIPEDLSKLGKTPPHLQPEKIIDQCTGEKLSKFYPIEHDNNPLHNDPRLDLGIYTGYYMPKGRLPYKKNKKLEENDLLLFMAGLAEYPEKFWSKRRRLSEIKKAFRESQVKDKAGIFIVGGIIIDEIIDISKIGWKNSIRRYPNIIYSPHYYRKNDYPVAVIGKGFLLRKPFKISTSKLKPTKNFIELIGKENAYNTARNNYRRTRIIYVKDIDTIIEQLFSY